MTDFMEVQSSKRKRGEYGKQGIDDNINSDRNIPGIVGFCHAGQPSKYGIDNDFRAGWELFTIIGDLHNSLHPVGDTINNMGA